MQICRFYLPPGEVRLGAIQDGMVYDLTSTGHEELISMEALFRFSARPGVDLLKRVKEALEALPPIYSFSHLDVAPDPSRPHLLSPVDSQEIWAAGVTYLRSQQARSGESTAPSVYDMLYDAERPELFLKATPDRVAGANDYICIRSDAKSNSPEPELTLALNPKLDLLGFLVGNDMGARDIEAENPMYLPQAKVFYRSCALGPAITLAQTVENSSDLNISCVVRRGLEVIFQGEVSTSRLKRSFRELISFLGRDNRFPNGVFLMTGTGIIPPEGFTLLEGDLVEISIEGLGTLRNPVCYVPQG